MKTIIVSLYRKLDRPGMNSVPSKFWYGKAWLHGCVATQLEDVILDSFSSPEPLDLICRLWTQRKIRSFSLAKQLNALTKLKVQCSGHTIILPALPNCKRKSSCLIYFGLLGLFAKAVKKRSEGKVWEVPARTMSLDKESLASLCINFASVSTVASGRHFLFIPTEFLLGFQSRGI